MYIKLTSNKMIIFREVAYQMSDRMMSMETKAKSSCHIHIIFTFQ